MTIKIETRGRKSLPLQKKLDQKLFVSSEQRDALERLTGKPYYLAARDVIDQFILANGGLSNEQK